jgi:hypothetical protein
MSEKKDIEDKVVVLAEARDWFVRKLEWQGRRGAPDRIFIKRGRVVFIEFKDRGKAKTGLSELQGRNRTAMQEAGAEIHVCDSVRHACLILQIPYRADPLRPHL